MTRRTAIFGAGTLVAMSGVRAQPPGRIPPLQDLVNASEFEAVAQRKLDALTFAEIAGSERQAFERITFRPRLMVDSRNMDLTAKLLGQTLFTPILVGPLSRLNRFHPEGELAMVRGASAAKAAVVVADHSGVPIERLAAEAKTPLWYQVYLEGDLSQTRARVQQAAAAGCKVLCVTIGTSEARSPMAGVDWDAIGRLRQGLGLPVVVKGVMSAEEAQKAVGMGLDGIVISNYSTRPLKGIAPPIEVLPAIADAVAGKTAILIDGSFRLGSDVMKALALGAQAVLLGRPVVWGLAAYGADGVQSVIELIQTGLARDMAMCGKTSLKALDRTVVTIHRR